MPFAESEPESGVWSVEGLPLRIEFAFSVLEEIAALAVDGLYRFRHGGMEVGGVMFGSIHPGVTRIAAFRPLDCEHAFGPRFVLSEKDRAAMEEIIDLPQGDAALAGLVPAGWYHSHTRSEVALSPRDLEIYNRYFPQPWQVALVLRPESYLAARAGFFVRERNGAVRGEACYQEFMIRPRRSGATPPEPEPAQEEPAPPVAAASASAPPVKTPAPKPAAEPELPPLPSFAHVEPGGSRKWLWMTLAIVLALAGGAGVEAYYRLYAQPQPLALWVADVGGQLLIEWDRTSKPIRQAQSATLEILDGKDRKEIRMDGDRLREGSVDYTRNSEIVDVRLRVNQSGARAAQEFIRFVGQPVRRPPTAEQTEVIRERDALKAEVESLRAEIQRRNALSRRPRSPVPPAKP